MSNRIKVLIVDDSAFVRKVITQILGRSPYLEVVGTARDGLDALEKVAELNPDVVTLDLMMPQLDGIGFLRRQMQIRPVPVIVCSIAHESGEAALEALDAGAVDFVQKPTALATDKVYEIGDELIQKVRAAAQATPSFRPPGAAAGTGHIVRDGRPPSVDVVVLGISTGGPQALRALIPQLPADFPVPVVMVMHMPVGYTEMYAQRLATSAPMKVVEAGDGETLVAGTAYLARAGHHLTLVRARDGSVRTHLDLSPGATPHRPSVDVLFRSAAAVYGRRVLGVVMTGMGEDGLDGAASIKAAGGRIVTEAESSCVVYGMPRAVESAGLSDRVAPLGDMFSAIQEMV